MLSATGIFASFFKILTIEPYFIRKGIVSGEQAAVIKGSGVNLSVFCPSPEPEGVPVVILASRMLWDKGVAQYVEAARILKSEGVKARFALAGEPDPDNPAAIPHAQLEVWDESGDVEWWGLQEGANMPAVLARSHIVCLPSYREGIPRILIEAAASGRPIVTTDAPGCRELVRPGENGIMVPSRDPSSLANALRFLIEHPETRIAMGKNNRQIAVQEFSQEFVIAQFMAVYRDLLRAASLGPGAPSHAPKEQRKGCMGSPDLHCRLSCDLKEDRKIGPRMARENHLAKRLLDLILSAAALVLIFPLLMAIALIAKLISPGPVLYRGKRIGLHGRPFLILKFRTMVLNAESLGGSATAADDPRLTRVGRFLRRFKLDELPQLLNVIKGEMSLVGPRPEVQKYVDLYSPEERQILTVLPGITDWASIWNSNEAAVLEGSRNPEKTYEELIRPTKLALQLQYVRNRSFSTDLKILIYTMCKLIFEDWIPRELKPYGKVKRCKVEEGASA